MGVGGRGRARRTLLVWMVSEPDGKSGAGRGGGRAEVRWQRLASLQHGGHMLTCVEHAEEVRLGHLGPGGHQPPAQRPQLSWSRTTGSSAVSGPRGSARARRRSSAQHDRHRVAWVDVLLAAVAAASATAATAASAATAAAGTWPMGAPCHHCCARMRRVVLRGERCPRAAAHGGGETPPSASEQP